MNKKRKKSVCRSLLALVMALCLLVSVGTPALAEESEVSIASVVFTEEVRTLAEGLSPFYIMANSRYTLVYADGTEDAGNESESAGTPVYSRDAWMHRVDSYGNRFYMRLLDENGELLSNQASASVAPGVYTLQCALNEEFTDAVSQTIQVTALEDSVVGTLTEGKNFVVGTPYDFRDCYTFTPSVSGTYTVRNFSSVEIRYRDGAEIGSLTCLGSGDGVTLEAGTVYYFSFVGTVWNERTWEMSDHYTVTLDYALGITGVRITPDAVFAEQTYPQDLLHALEYTVQYQDGTEEASVSGSEGQTWEYYMSRCDSRGSVLYLRLCDADGVVRIGDEEDQEPLVAGNYTAEIAPDEDFSQVLASETVRVASAEESAAGELKVGTNTVTAANTYETWYTFQPPKTQEYSITGIYDVKLLHRDGGQTVVHSYHSPAAIVELKAGVTYYLSFVGERFEGYRYDIQILSKFPKLSSISFSQSLVSVDVTAEAAYLIRQAGFTMHYSGGYKDAEFRGDADDDVETADYIIRKDRYGNQIFLRLLDEDGALAAPHDELWTEVSEGRYTVQAALDEDFTKAVTSCRLNVKEPRPADLDMQVRGTLHEGDNTLTVREHAESSAKKYYQLTLKTGGSFVISTDSGTYALFYAKDGEEKLTRQEGTELKAGITYYVEVAEDATRFSLYRPKELTRVELNAARTELEGCTVGRLLSSTVYRTVYSTGETAQGTDAKGRELSKWDDIAAFCDKYNNMVYLQLLDANHKPLKRSIRLTPGSYTLEAATNLEFQHPVRQTVTIAAIHKTSAEDLQLGRNTVRFSTDTQTIYYRLTSRQARSYVLLWQEDAYRNVSDMVYCKEAGQAAYTQQILGWSDWLETKADSEYLFAFYNNGSDGKTSMELELREVEEHDLTVGKNTVRYYDSSGDNKVHYYFFQTDHIEDYSIESFDGLLYLYYEQNGHKCSISGKTRLHAVPGITYQYVFDRKEGSTKNETTFALVKVPHVKSITLSEKASQMVAGIYKADEILNQIGTWVKNDSSAQPIDLRNTGNSWFPLEESIFDVGHARNCLYYDLEEDRFLYAYVTKDGKAVSYRKPLQAGTYQVTFAVEEKAYDDFDDETKEKIYAYTTEETVVGTAEFTLREPTIQTNAQNDAIVLKTGQSTSGLRISGLAEGDSIKSITNSNSKAVALSKVNLQKGTCTLTAKKLTGAKGKSVLTITLNSGLVKKLNISVQKSAVKTGKITVVQKTIRLKKGEKAKVGATVWPFTSTEKVTYTVKNKALASVSSKGVLTAKAKGKTTLTIRSGTKKCTVNVEITK